MSYWPKIAQTVKTKKCFWWYCFWKNFSVVNSRKNFRLKKYFSSFSMNNYVSDVFTTNSSLQVEFSRRSAEFSFLESTLIFWILSLARVGYYIFHKTHSSFASWDSLNHSKSSRKLRFLALLKICLLMFCLNKICPKYSPSCKSKFP